MENSPNLVVLINKSVDVAGQCLTFHFIWLSWWGFGGNSHRFMRLGNLQRRLQVIALLLWPCHSTFQVRWSVQCLWHHLLLFRIQVVKYGGHRLLLGLPTVLGTGHLECKKQTKLQCAFLFLSPHCKSEPSCHQTQGKVTNERPVLETWCKLTGRILSQACI